MDSSTYTGTHLEFMPPPGEHSEHNHASTDSEMQNMDMNSHDGQMDHSNQRMKECLIIKQF